MGFTYSPVCQSNLTTYCKFSSGTSFFVGSKTTRSPRTRISRVLPSISNVMGNAMRLWRVASTSEGSPSDLEHPPPPDGYCDPAFHDVPPLKRRKWRAAGEVQVLFCQCAISPFAPDPPLVVQRVLMAGSPLAVLVVGEQPGPEIGRRRLSGAHRDFRVLDSKWVVDHQLDFRFFGEAWNGECSRRGKTGFLRSRSSESLPSMRHPAGHRRPPAA